MSQTVNNAFVIQFGNDLERLVQQEGSKIYPHVRAKSIVGKFCTFNRLGAGSVSEKLTRHADTPEPMNLEHSTRACVLRTFNGSEMLDKSDQVRMLLDPTNEYSLSIADAMGRQVDDILLAGLYGNAKAMDTANALSDVALSAGQIIDEDFNSESNSKITLAKLREARRILQAADVNLDREMPIMLISPTDADALLAISQVTSSDYNTVRTLVNGRVETFMGFKFVVTTRLELAAHKTSEGFARCIAFVPSALGVATNREKIIRIGERNDKCYSTEIYGEMDIGAVRRQEEKVVVIESYRA